MRAGELLALGYFLLVGSAALALWRRRGGAPVALGLSAAGGLIAAASTSAPGVLRDWCLLPALPLAYWAPAPLAGTANLSLEQWLRAVDNRLGLTRLEPAAHGLLEFAYLLVYPMVPAGVLAVTITSPHSAEGFWLAVFAAVLPCYGLLPLFPTRPPRAFLLPHGPSPGPTSTWVRRANVLFLATFGNAWNTLPSGHAAGAAAIAVLVWRSGSPLGPVFVLLAVGIALGTVRGRYHYAVDTILGVALGVIAGLST